MVVAPVSFLLIIGFALIKSSFAFPDGVGGCPERKAGVDSSPHIENAATITMGTLEDGGFRVSIGSARVSTGGTLVLDIGIPYSITLAGTAINKFHGFLVRAGVSDTTAITPNAKTGKSCAPCTVAGVAGISHFENSLKSSVTGTIMFDSAATGIPLDITIVRDFHPGGNSVYYYSGYTIDVVAGGGPPTPAPAPRPIRNALCDLIGVFCL